MLEKTCCGGDVLILACSGGSNVGQVSNEAAKALTEQGQGKLYCTIAIGAGLENFIETTKQAGACVAIDGCPMGCVKKALENAGLEPNVYVLVTELGIEKQPGLEARDDDVAKVASAVTDALQGPACCVEQSGDCCACDE